ncbi:type Z 30S ribosomal protein S14, partial [Treponema pallidum]
MATVAMINKAKATPKYATRRYNRCGVCGRPRGYMRRFQLCRLCFRKLASEGQIPGVTKS